MKVAQKRHSISYALLVWQTHVTWETKASGPLVARNPYLTDQIRTYPATNHSLYLSLSLSLA